MVGVIKIELTEDEVRHLKVLIEMAMGTPEFFAPGSETQMLQDSTRIYEKLFCAGNEPGDKTD